MKRLPFRQCVRLGVDTLRHCRCPECRSIAYNWFRRAVGLKPKRVRYMYTHKERW